MNRMLLICHIEDGTFPLPITRIKKGLPGARGVIVSVWCEFDDADRDLLKKPSGEYMDRVEVDLTDPDGSQQFNNCYKGLTAFLRSGDEDFYFDVSIPTEADAQMLVKAFRALT